ncbi:MAG: YceD family protein [Flavobacteriales bacterium]|jgi:uncharacterized protein
MRVRSEYIVEFSGLKNGSHSYDWTLGDAFFDGFNRDGFQQSKLQVSCRMDKDETMLVFHLSIDGVLDFDCDRCLTPFTFRLKGNKTLVFKLNGTASEEEDEDLFVLDASEYQIDMAPHLNDLVQILLPMKRLCQMNEGKPLECDPEMLAKLEAYSTSAEEPEHIDPRWEKLQQLKSDDN